MPMYFGPHYLPPAYQMYAVEQIKEVVKNIPIVAVGRINDPLLAESLIAEGKTDIVAMARPLIADPELPNKAKEGRLDDIRPCMGDNQNCVKYMMDGQPIRCLCNATVGMEQLGWGIGGMKKAATKKKVVVVGAGPAGLEAARVAALRGHDVTLYDKLTRVGGLLPIAALVKGTELEDLPAMVRYLRRQVVKLGVKINLGQEVGPATIEAIKPDAVIIAAGGVPAMPEIKGIESRKVVSSADLHRKLKFFLRFLGPDTIRWR